jgi:hypothetical protein
VLKPPFTDADFQIWDVASGVTAVFVDPKAVAGIKLGLG